MNDDHTVPLTKITAFMSRNARPLDWARWRYLVADGSRNEVLSCLGAYQNEDGGFAHALEADCWNPESSPIQTWAATEILREIEVPFHHPVMDGIWSYLDSGKAYEQGRWLASIPSYNDHPHAPWWTYRSDEDVLATWGFNPSAALAGFILAYGCDRPGLQDKAVKIARAALDHLQKQQNRLEMHECACYLRLLSDLLRSENEKVLPLANLKEGLRICVRHCLCQDTSRWASEYVCRPSHLGIVPHSLFFAEYEALAQTEARFLIENMQADGTWPIPWNWSDYAEAWPISRLWWQAHQNITNLRFLNTSIVRNPLLSRKA